jgi:hypothetical protein
MDELTDISKKLEAMAVQLDIENKASQTKLKAFRKAAMGQSEPLMEVETSEETTSIESGGSSMP